MARSQVNHLKKRLYSIPEAAEYLGRSENAIRELIWAGTLPQVRSDRRVFLDVEDLDRFIEQHKRAETF